MPSSLATLANNLPAEACKYLARFYEGEKFTLMKQKGEYPYDWVDSLDKLKETQLPPKEKFYNLLNDTHMTDKGYKHALKVWDVFDMQTFGDFHDKYLETDVLLLADIFENFRKVNMEHCGLDLAWLFTKPGLTWDAGLKKTKIKLELMTDPDMANFIDSMIRGGVSSVPLRYAKANNPDIMILANHQ